MITRASVVVIGILILTGPSYSEPAKSSEDVGAKRYIGTRYPPLPSEVLKGDGALITDESEVDSDYGLNSVTKGNVQMIWFSIAENHDGKNGITAWRVLDVISVSKDDYISKTLCFQNEKRNPEIVALIGGTKSGKEEERYDLIRKAWRANRQTGKFEPMDTNGISCINEGYGL